MSRLIPENARSRARLARPLSAFTPEQRRLLLALIEAGNGPTASPAAGGAPRRMRGPARS